MKTDSDHAEHIYESLTQAGFKVWWDKSCLEPGTSWEEGYVRTVTIRLTYSILQCLTYYNTIICVYLRYTSLM